MECKPRGEVAVVAAVSIPPVGGEPWGEELTLGRVGSWFESNPGSSKSRVKGLCDALGLGTETLTFYPPFCPAQWSTAAEASGAAGRIWSAAGSGASARAEFVLVATICAILAAR